MLCSRWHEKVNFVDSRLRSEEHLRTYACLLPNEAENHKDPSDHLIISHAMTNKMPLISRDRKFHFYKAQGLDLIYYGN